MALIKYVSPAAPSLESSQATATRTLQSHSLRLGILDNGKGNADHLLSVLTAGLQAEFAIASVTVRRKRSASSPADSKLIDELAAESDYVVSAMAD